MKKPSSVDLVASHVHYLSEEDEEAFFRWLETIPCVARVKGIGAELHLTVKLREVTDERLREILALFYRYDVDMKQLAVFRNDVNASWFSRSTAYWYSRVFE